MDERRWEILEIRSFTDKDRLFFKEMIESHIAFYADGFYDKFYELVSKNIKEEFFRALEKRPSIMSERNFRKGQENKLAKELFIKALKESLQFVQNWIIVAEKV